MKIATATVTTEGKVWVGELPDMEDLEVQVAPWENAAFRRRLQKLIGMLPPGQRADGRVDPIAHDNCVGRAILDTVLFDWRNMVGEDGFEQPYNKELAAQYLCLPKYMPFRDAVVVAAKRVQAGQVKETEDLEKNSSSSSAGSAAGGTT